MLTMVSCSAGVNAWAGEKGAHDCAHRAIMMPLRGMRRTILTPGVALRSTHRHEVNGRAASNGPLSLWERGRG